METVPAQVHMHVAEFERSVRPWRVTVGAPGVHGEPVIGTQGMGVSTPNAAAVAAATVGLDGDWQSPKEGMCTMGITSKMVAAG